MNVPKSPKGNYTELEAAEELGVSIERLRSLIRAHVVHSDEELTNVPMATFQPSDLLLLRFLCKQGGEPQEA